jgi:hypothetical protein
MQPLPISKSKKKLRVMCRFPSVLFVCTLLCSCGSGDPRLNQSVQTEPQYRALTLAQIPQNTEEERVLAAYKHYYERFRSLENFNATLPIREEARLAQDYVNARDAFNDWLQFVTDSIQEQSELKSDDALPEFRYRYHADAALSAMRTLDADLLDSCIYRGLTALGTRMQRSDLTILDLNFGTDLTVLAQTMPGSLAQLYLRSTLGRSLDRQIQTFQLSQTFVWLTGPASDRSVVSPIPF